MADMAPNWTPFRYGFNNPITMIDPTGMLEETSDRIGGGLNYAFGAANTLKDDPFQDKRYNVGNPEEQNTKVNAPGCTELNAEETEEFLRKASEKEQNSAQNFINDGSSSAFSMASSAGSNTITPVENQATKSDGGKINYSLGQNGIGLNIGGGIGVMAQSVEFNIGAFVNSNGFGQMYFSYGYFNQKAPLYVNAGASAQALYIHTQAPKIDLSGGGKTAGLGIGPVAMSYGYSYNDKGQRTAIYGAGAGLGIKYSGGFTNTKTFTTLFINWWPSMNFHLP